MFRHEAVRVASYYHPVFTGSCLTISICVCSTYLVDEKILVLLVLLKEMRMLGKSEVRSFFCIWSKSGRVRRWDESKTSLCNPKS